MKRGRSVLPWIYGTSAAAHLVFAVVAVLLPKPQRTETIAIELADIKKKKEPPPAPPPPPPPADKPKPPPPKPARAEAQAKIAPEAARAEMPETSAPAAGGFADLGVALGNGSPGEGVAVAASPTSVAASAAPAAAKPTQHKVEQLAPAAAETCSDPVIRPKRKVPVAPKYTMEARQAEIEGVVRVEVTVDEKGNVIAARILSGLGYGLDQSALDAAKASTFEPATRCGKPLVGTVVLPFRFEST